MKPTYIFDKNPLAQGIQVIGIGRHGSKPLSEALLEDIVAYLEHESVVPIQKGAFFGALMAKGPTEREMALLEAIGVDAVEDSSKLYDRLCADSPAYMRQTGIKLLNKETLNKSEAEALGNYLFSAEEGETYRGMAASMLRIRYETEAEYHGLMMAAAKTYTAGFQGNGAGAGTSIQLAEPFDGVEHSYMLTPLLGQALQDMGYRVVVSMGRSSGPKVALNTLDLYKALGADFIRENPVPGQERPAFGWPLDQAVLSPALDRWVDRRHLLIKRPFLATLEKVLNPCHAQILICSVFHITYMEKMLKLGFMAGFSGVIVLKRGLEGSLAPSLARASGILCAVQQADGSVLSQTFDADHEDFARFRADSDELVEAPQAADNLKLIRQYLKQGFTINEDFDKRAGLALALYKAGLQWIQQQQQGVY